MPSSSKPNAPRQRQMQPSPVRKAPPGGAARTPPREPASPDSRISLESSARKPALGRVIVSAFSAISLAGLFTLWRQRVKERQA